MSRRPLCVLLAGFLLIQVFRLWRMEPEPERPFLSYLGEEGSTILCSGIVRRWEEREDGTICYDLTSVSKESVSDTALSDDNKSNFIISKTLNDEGVILNDLNSNNSISNASGQKQISQKQFTGEQSTEKQFAGKQFTEGKDSNWKIRVYDKEGGIRFPVGSRVQVRGTLRYFERAVNPGMFDSRAFYRRKGIAAMVFAKQMEEISEGMQTGSLPQAKVKQMLCRFRTAWKKKLFRGMDEKHAATVSAILLGEKSGMDTDLKEEFQLGGIGHILAISSLHMSLLGIGLYQFLRKRGLSFLCAGILGSSFLGLYVLMVGIGVSTTRALVMYLVKMGAEITGRTYDGWTALFLSAAVVTGVQPLYFTDSGFWLSFGAIAGILLWQEVWKNLVVKLEKKRSQKRGTTKFTGVAVQIFLLPVQLFYQYEVSGYSILLNAVVIPLMPILLGSALMGSVGLAGESLPVVGQMAWKTGRIMLKGTALLLEGYQRVCQIALKLPGARIIAGRPELWKIAGYYLLIFIGVWIATGRKEWEKMEGKRKKKKREGVKEE